MGRGNGGNFREGYKCVKCIEEQTHYHGRQDPDPSLYRRDKSGFHHSGFVECSKHGIQKGKRIKDL